MRLTVSMTNITVPQALTLKAMFEYWMRQPSAREGGR